MLENLTRSPATWEQGDYVLFSRDEKAAIGLVHVFGLDAVGNAAQGEGRPELEVIGMERQTTHWLKTWVDERWARVALPPSPGRNLTIRDNLTKRWFYLDGARVRRIGATPNVNGPLAYFFVVEELREREDEAGPGW